MKKDYIAILAHCQGILGYNNDLVHKDSEDLEHFKSVTDGHIVIMGRKTIDSLPRKLPNRTVVCLTRDKNYHSAKCDYVFTDINELMKFCDQSKIPGDVFVAGGSEIYDLFLPHLTAVYVTDFNPKLLNREELNQATQVARMSQDFISALQSWPIQLRYKVINSGVIYYMAPNLKMA